MSISVIIPVKNRAELLKKTLDNILAQTLQPSEIIVVDDHSTDGLHEVKEKYADRVTFISNAGTGPGAARNTGFLASIGKYIQFFDSDDLMTLDKLEIQFNQLEKSTSMMAYCSHVKAIEQKNEWKQTDSILYFKPLSNRLRYDQWLIRGACMITQSCLFKRELIEKAGLWRTDLMPHEDLEFLFRIGMHEPYPVHSTIPTVIYRQHEFQITDKNTTSASRADDQVKAFKLIHAQMDSNRYGFWDKRIIENNILQAIKHSSIQSNEFHTLYNTAFAYLTKCKNKIERIITKSNWRFVHGVNNSSEQFDRYVRRIKHV